MRFATIVSYLALAVSVNAAIGAQQMASNIDTITQKSSETNDIAKSISVTNFFSTTPQMINNFKDIIETVTQDITAMNNKRSLQARQECLDVTNVEQCIQDLGEIIEDPSEILGKKRNGFARNIANIMILYKIARQDTSYSEIDQQAVCNSFRSFVMVHQELLKTVIGKHGLLSLTPFTQPIAAVLRTLEGGVDTIAFGIIDSVPYCSQDATQNKNSLDSTLGDAIDTYSA
ncbi:hypothetical protein N7450_011575 [Penicillium hetheringtonii]|uniref:Uncharacterized protein n=1 Tax=Penicillium hetheringtonii TaxID=911720 RepID=A0AAD6GNS4_9EURO|nr:hypothetical protein N7450_011575 [Penicillium hetheringtonii]